MYGRAHLGSRGTCGRQVRTLGPQLVYRKRALQVDMARHGAASGRVGLCKQMGVDRAPPRLGLYQGHVETLGHGRTSGRDEADAKDQGKMKKRGQKQHETETVGGLEGCGLFRHGVSLFRRWGQGLAVSLGLKGRQQVARDIQIIDVIQLLDAGRARDVDFRQPGPDDIQTGEQDAVFA